MNVIEVEGLRKEYRPIRGKRTLAIDGLDLTVGSGGVFGFLGPNGSGKTTTIRCLLGLVRPTEGMCRILGSDVRQHPDVIHRVGSIVEGPALFPNFSARRNLRLLARMDGIDLRRVDEMLELVGLGERGNELVRGYSLGMRQRLAIGAALMKDPDLLILDEPANGLDPSGIREVRELVRRLGSQGHTVFVSSHLLSEVQQTCDHVAILAHGRCVATGAVADVLSGGAVASMLVRVDDQAHAVAVLNAAGLSSEIHDDALRVRVGADQGSLISEALARHGIFPSELRAEQTDLETVFLSLTQEAKEAAA
ncbi:MAG: ATP-binding cassette domain-containing protein [Actinomycetota bacterium]|nr:ATP-binding cassette domain-containing protein [Actinomycetota bacterium]